MSTKLYMLDTNMASIIIKNKPRILWQSYKTR